MRGDGVREAARLVDAGQRGQDLGRHLLVQFHVLLELGNDRAHEHVDLAFVVAVFLVEDGDVRGEMITHGDVIDTGSLCTLDEHLDGAIG